MVNINKIIVDEHEQLEPFSCIPSAVELVLKLLGKAPVGYYDLQKSWKNKKTGSFLNFNGKTIAGVTFESKFSPPNRGKCFPINDLFKAIDVELDAGKFVVISLKSPLGWHMYVIYNRLNSSYNPSEYDYLAFTKNGKHTTEANDVKKCVLSMGGTDILIYNVNQL